MGRPAHRARTAGEECERWFGPLLDKLEELGIDPDPLAECLATMPQ